MEDGRSEEAEELLLHSVRVAPESPYGPYNLAILRHREQRRPAEALELYEQAAVAALRRLPQSADLWIEIRLSQGTCLAELGRGGEALEIFLDLAGKPPHPPRAARNAAVLWRQQGRMDEVERVLTAALEHHPEDAGLLKLLIDTYQWTGRPEAARDLSERLGSLQKPAPSR